MKPEKTQNDKEVLNQDKSKFDPQTGELSHDWIRKCHKLGYSVKEVLGA